MLPEEPRNRHDRLRGLCSDRTLHQGPSLTFQLKSRVLMGLAAGNRGDALHEIEDAFRLAIFFAEYCFNDFRRLVLGEAILAQKALAVLVAAGDELAKLVSAAAASWAKPLRGKLRMPDGDLLEIPHTPEIAIHAGSAEIEARNTQRFAADFAVPAGKSPEIQVR